MDCCWGHWWRCCHDNQRLKTQQILACILWYICTIKICLMLPYLLYINEGSTLVQTFIWFGFFGLKNKMFLDYFFLRLVLFVDITRVLSLIVIKPLLEDSLVCMNPFTFFFNHGFDFPLLYKVTIRRQSVLWYVHPVTLF